MNARTPRDTCAARAPWGRTPPPAQASDCASWLAFWRIHFLAFIIPARFGSARGTAPSRVWPVELLHVLRLSQESQAAAGSLYVPIAIDCEGRRIISIIS